MSVLRRSLHAACCRVPERARRSSVLFFALPLFLGLLLCACAPRRPANVPGSATYIPGTPGWWQDCYYEPRLKIDVCHIFTYGGQVLAEGVFLPYDGGDAVLPPDLVINPNVPLAGTHYIFLKNGRILLPKADFDELKNYLDSTKR